MRSRSQEYEHWPRSFWKDPRSAHGSPYLASLCIPCGYDIICQQWFCIHSRIIWTCSLQCCRYGRPACWFTLHVSSTAPFLTTLATTFANTFLKSLFLKCISFYLRALVFACLYVCTPLACSVHGGLKRALDSLGL